METQQNPAQPLIRTPADQWAGAVQVEGSDVALPSGNVARVRQISPAAFLASGLIPNPLMSIIRKSIQEKSGMSPAAMKKITEDNALLVSALELFDRVLAHVMVQPEVKMPPPCKVCGEYANTNQHDSGMPKTYHQYKEGDREAGVPYADVVQMDDKMFIFQWAVGGTRDLETFREEFQSRVGDLSNG